MTTPARIAAVVLVFLALLAGVSGLAIAVMGDETASTTSRQIQTLLLNGKTASAKSAKKTALEVETLLTEFAHSSQQQKATKALIAGVEQHLDATIRRAVTDAAEKVAKDFGR
jgi:hypothetical protein